MAYREAFHRAIKVQVDDYLATASPSSAPDASTELAVNHLPPSVVRSLLEHIEGNAVCAEELALYHAGVKGLSRARFLEIWQSDEARGMRLQQIAPASHSPLDVVNHWEKYSVRPHERLPVDPPKLAVPDAEAADAALHGEQPEQSGGHVLESRFGAVRKLGQGWRKAWQPRWLFVEARGFGYHHARITAQVFEKDPLPALKKLIPFSEIVGVCVATPENTPGKTKLKPGCFNVTVQTGRTYTFACDTAGEAVEWCRSIASHVLVHAVKTKSGGLDRVRAFVEAGGNVNGTFKKGNQSPLLATALATDSVEVAKYLLSIGADAKCLLRWNFLAGKDKSATATPVSILNLLTSAHYDLNIAGDDRHHWTLLHYLCYNGNFDEVDRILLPKLKDTFLDTSNTIGDTALTLILKTIAAGKYPTEAVEPIAIQLAQRCHIINHSDSDGDNALHLAIKLKCAELAQVLVEMGADTRVRDSHGNTALHLAIKTQQPEIVDLIAEHAARVGVVPRAVNSVSVASVPVAVPEDEVEDREHEEVPLGHATMEQPSSDVQGEDEHGHHAASRHRIQTPTAGVAALLDQRDGAFGDTALVMAIKLGQEEMACMLVRHGASTMRGSNMWGHENCSGDEVLHVAIKMGMVDLALLCVQHGSNLGSRDTHGRTALHLALLHGNLLLVQRVADSCKSNAPATDSEGVQLETPCKEHQALVEAINSRESSTKESVLMICLGFRQMELACSLLDAGASLALTNIAGESPLHRMIHLVCREYFTRNLCRRACSLALMADMLRIGGADPYLACEPEKSTPFHVVAWHGQEDAVLDAAKILIEHNPELANARDRHGDSVLLCAIVRGNEQIAKLVINAGCNVDIVNGKGNSALHVAVNERKADLVKALLEHGAYPGVWDRQGMCPIHYAAGRGDTSVIEVFAESCLQEGHFNYRTEDGLTPAMLAVSHAQVESLQSLMQYDVDLRLVVPGTRQGILHVALNTCLDDSIEAVVKAKLIDTLTSVDVTELTMAQSFAGDSSTGIAAESGAAGGGKRMFSAAKCLEAMVQMRERLDVQREHDAVDDESQDISQDMHEEKDGDEEDAVVLGSVERRLEHEFENNNEVSLGDESGEDVEIDSDKRTAQELERVLDRTHREEQRARAVEKHGDMSERTLTAEEIKHQRVPIPYGRNIPDDMLPIANKKPIAGGARARLLGSRRESTMGGPKVKELVKSFEQDAASEASDAEEDDNEDEQVLSIPRSSRTRAMTASIKSMSSSSLNNKENSTTRTSVRSKLLSTRESKSTRSALSRAGSTSSKGGMAGLPTAFNADGSRKAAKAAASNVTMARGAGRNGAYSSSEYADAGSDTEDEGSNKGSKERNSGFLESLNEADYARILGKIKQEATDTANEWIASKAGKRMLQRRAKELLANGSATDMQGALTMAEENFVTEHVEDSLDDVKGMSEEIFKERVTHASQASMVA